METILVQKRVLKSSITKSLNELQRGSLSDIELELYEKKCNKYEVECSELFAKIYQNCDKKDIDNFVEEQQSVQESIDKLWISAKEELSKFKTNPDNSVNINQNRESGEGVRLPKLNLPSFSGCINEWLSFKDLFVASIHNNNTLSGSQKLSYLKLSLQGEALRIIQSISLCDANYKLAWDLLEERFSNKKDQVFAQLHRFMNIPPIQNESPASILKLVDTVNEVTRCLETLEQKVEGFSETILAYQLLQKLDANSKLWYEREVKKDDLPKLSELILFLKNYARTLQASKMPNNSVMKKQNNPKFTTMTASVKSQEFKCVCCKSSNVHSLQKCYAFKKMSVFDRINFAKRKNLCFRCLSANAKHSAINCNYSVCNICFKNHHNLLHINKEKEIMSAGSQLSLPMAPHTPNQSDFPPTSSNIPLNADAKCFELSDNNSREFVATSLNSKIKNKRTILSTAIVYIKNIYGKYIPCNCLLDVGSQSNYLSSSLANLLGIKREKVSISVSCLGGISFSINSKITTSVSNCVDYARTLDFFLVPKINDLLPETTFEFNFSEIPNGIKLADPYFNKKKRIEILLGAEAFYEFLKPEQICLRNTNIILQNSVWGYIVGGCIYPSEFDNKTSCGLICNVEDNLDKLVKHFWEIENSYDQENNVVKSKEEIFCEEHFLKTHSRNESGRYTVQMPLKENPNCLGESKQIAINRLNTLWKRLSKDPVYVKLYSNFIQEYEQLNHMELVNETEEPKLTFYLPHHGVYRPEKLSTKLRVVFNASQPSSNGISLNNLQYNGGVIQDDIFSIMLRFRLHYIVFITDIKQMYRMIQIDPTQRDLQRIVWKEGLNEPIKIYKLSTITYGTTSAPYLATRTLQQLACDEEKNFPLAAKIVKRDTYMDDIVTGCSNVEEGQTLKQELINLLESGCMQLHKWHSNKIELLQGIHTNLENYSFSEPSEIKTLGVLWEPKDDEFRFKVQVEQLDNFTKRSVLSTIARIYDPIGLIGPVIVKAKEMMQKLWVLKINWNDMVPETEANDWKKFLTSLQAINDLKISRCILVSDAKIIELHGFSDSSAIAYGASIYCKSISNTGQISVNLLTSKSRISPLKQVSIPRLELCGAVLLAKLMKRVISSLKLNIDSVMLWSDSMIVLSWIKKEPHLLKTFVANRITVIQELTEGMQWRHVSSQDNPSDLLSRGVSPEKISACDLWWHGPQFLQKNDYPNKEVPVNIISDNFSRELKTEDCTNSNLCFTNISLKYSFINDIINISNKYTKLIRIVAFIFRFINNCRKEKRVGPLDFKELRNSEIFLLKEVQRGEFKNEIMALQKCGKVSDNSKLKCVFPFLDSDNVLRCGGRLSNSEYNLDKKFPIILPKSHKITVLIAEHYHERSLHIGPQGLLFLMRRKFWPLSGRNLCRKIVHNCITCFKAKPIPCEQIMGQLPKERIEQNFPFNCVGVDFFGPYFIKYPNQRKGNYSKIYVSIFVCFVTKACHFELVNDLSSDAFIATLKRFFSRRGKCAKIFSDNATNFVGSNRELIRLNKLISKPDEILGNYLSCENIDWTFIPPRAPNHGGLWEAGVKSAKYHLKRVVGNLKLTYEEFLTVLAQVEAILNSRPLHPLTSNLDDFDALTPGHFLIGRPITAIAEPNILYVPDNRLKAYQKITKIIQTFWKNWTNNYLSAMHEITKWYYEKDNVQIGTMVILKVDNVPVCNWPLGRIVEVFTGKDQKVRVVLVKTKEGLFRRSINKICILPIDNYKIKY